MEDKVQVTLPAVTLTYYKDEQTGAYRLSRDFDSNALGKQFQKIAEEKLSKELGIEASCGGGPLVLLPDYIRDARTF